MGKILNTTGVIILSGASVLAQTGQDKLDAKSLKTSNDKVFILNKLSAPFQLPTLNTDLALGSNDLAVNKVSKKKTQKGKGGLKNVGPGPTSAVPESTMKATVGTVDSAASRGVGTIEGATDDGLKDISNQAKNAKTVINNATDKVMNTIDSAKASSLQEIENASRALDAKINDLKQAEKDLQRAKNEQPSITRNKLTGWVFKLNKYWGAAANYKWHMFSGESGIYLGAGANLVGKVDSGGVAPKRVGGMGNLEFGITNLDGDKIGVGGSVVKDTLTNWFGSVYVDMKTTIEKSIKIGAKVLNEWHGSFSYLAVRGYVQKFFNIGDFKVGVGGDAVIDGGTAANYDILKQRNVAYIGVLGGAEYQLNEAEIVGMNFRSSVMGTKAGSTYSAEVYYGAGKDFQIGVFTQQDAGGLGDPMYRTGIKIKTNW